MRKMGVGREAAHAILERLEGGGRVTGAIAHTIIIGEIGVIARPVDIGDPALREDIRVVAVGIGLLVTVEREDRGVLYAGHGVAGGERGDLAGAAAVGGGNAAHHVVRGAV